MPEQLKLPDGRNLDYLISGAKDGFPLMYIHGTPGAYLPIPGFPEACEKKGIKLITTSRAGYGGSSRLKGRSIVDFVADIRALKEHLGIGKCFVGGWSGGGPHVLACAARLPGCVAALCVAGVAPYDAEGLDWMEGQGEDNVQETEAALKGEPVIYEFCSAQRPDMLSADAVSIVETMSSLLPEVDKKALLDNPKFSQNIVDDMHEGLKTNVDGWVDDSMAFINPWGFELDEIKVPVFLYQGSDDKMVPFGHGKWLAEHLPQKGLSVNLVEGHGHISIWLGQEDKMLDELLAVKVS